MPRIPDLPAETEALADTDKIAVYDASGAETRRVDVGGNIIPQSTRIYRATVQSIPNNALTTLSYSNERWDDLGAWAAGSPTKFVVPVTGLYQIGAFVTIENDDVDGVRYADIYNDTSDVVIAQLAPSGYPPPPGTAELLTLHGETLWKCTQNDEIIARVYQNSGSALDVQAGGAADAVKNDFWICRLR